MNITVYTASCHVSGHNPQRVSIDVPDCLKGSSITKALQHIFAYKFMMFVAGGVTMINPEFKGGNPSSLHTMREFKAYADTFPKKTLDQYR